MRYSPFNDSANFRAVGFRAVGFRTVGFRAVGFAMAAAIGFSLAAASANAVPFQSGTMTRAEVVPVTPQDAESEIEFAADNEPVLVFGFGGLNPPRIQIFKDGTVKTAGREGYVPELQSKISKEELQKIVQFAYDEARLLDATTAFLKEKTSGLRVADGPTSTFRLHVADGENTVQVYALAFASRAGEVGREMKTLVKLQNMCNHIFYLTQIGTSEEQAALLSQVEGQLKKKLPNVKSLTMNDLKYASRNIKGKIRGSFSTTRSIDEKPHNVGASFERDAEASEFTVKISSSVVRKRTRRPIGGGGIQVMPVR